jgi:hypothetical protein
VTEPWKQKRGKGAARLTEVIRARIDPATAERIDLACLALQEPLCEFVRRALADRLSKAEGLIRNGEAPR